MDNKTYNVVINKPAELNADTVEKFSSLFKTSIDKATAILQKENFAIKKQTDKQTAEKFHSALKKIGVSCRIEEFTEEESALPTIEDVKQTEVTSSKPLIDPTQPDIKPLDEEDASLSLEASPVEKARTGSEEKAIEDIAAENFCPECGTIRASADSACVHCSYDPQVIKQGKTKAIITKAALGIAAIVIIIIAGLPFYQGFMKQKQLEEDLKLAFDTRNQVTEFITKTNFWPNQNIDAGLPKSIQNRSIKSVLIGDNAMITVTLRAEVLEGQEQTLIFTPNTLKGRIVWNCIKGTLDVDLRPEICRPAEK